MSTGDLTVEVELSRRLKSGISNGLSTIFLPQLFGKFDMGMADSFAFPKFPPLGSFPQAHPGSLPAASSSIYLGGGSGGGAVSNLAPGIANAGAREKGIAADRLVDRLRPWLALRSCTREEGGDVTGVKSIKGVSCHSEKNECYPKRS